MKPAAVTRHRDQAGRPGPRGAGSRGAGSRGAAFRAAAAALGIAAVAAAGVTAFLVTRPGPHPARAPAPSPAQTYGSLPGWLPQPSVPVGRVVTASPAHPRLAIEGDTVHVLLPGAQVMATAVGPQVPEEGRFPVPETTRCTFTVTFARATGPLTLRAADFATVDERGHLHRLRLHVRGGGPLPARVPAGHTVSVVMTGRLPTGNGQLIWAPDGRNTVSWDFSVEID